MSKVIDIEEQNFDMFCLNLLLKTTKVGREIYKSSNYKFYIDYGTMEDGKVGNELTVYKKGAKKPLAIFYVDFGQRVYSCLYTTKDSYIKTLDMMLDYYLESFDCVDPRYHLGITKEELAV